MPDPIKINVAEWVASAKADPVAYQQRQTVEITLNAIAMTAPLNAKMFLKGGILMGLAYDSPRQTTDIDLTTELKVESAAGDKISKAVGFSVRTRFCRTRLSRPHRRNPFGKAPTKDDLQNCEFPCLDAQNRLGEARNNTREGAKERYSTCRDCRRHLVQ